VERVIDPCLGQLGRQTMVPLSQGRNKFNCRSRSHQEFLLEQVRFNTPGAALVEV
jgi:hypothetical protein